MNKSITSWDYSSCYEEAKNYRSRSEFHDNSRAAYRVASKNDWLNDYTWFKPKGEKKWNRETCYNEALKYKSRGEFGDKCQGAYEVARAKGWLNDYTWFTTLWQNKWDKKSCAEEARKYKSQKEFQKNSKGAFSAAYRKGWLKDYTWFKRPEAYNKQWTREKCAEESKKYSTRGEFQKNSRSAYSVARKNGWLDDYTWLGKRDAKPQGYWDREKCYGEAQKYKSRKEFQKYSTTAYHVARVNGWLDDYTWFQKRVLSDKPIYVVYRYYDEDTNSVYVGLAKDVQQRHKEHCNGFIRHGERKFDTVYKFFHSIRKDVPKPAILEKELYADEAQIYEELYIEQYRNDGFNVLNIAKAGSLGAYAKWTKEKCDAEAKKYSTLSDFRKIAAQAYTMARKNGWIKDYIWLERLNGFWTREKCAEEAKKYKTRTEFQDNAGGAYQAALKNGWLDDYTWFVTLIRPNGYWTYEKCYNEAVKYKSRREFCNNAKGAYEVARQNKWLDDFTWFSPSQSEKKWDMDSCRNEALKYQSLKEFQKKNGRAYQISLKNDWIKDYTWLKRKHVPNGYWTHEKCADEARKYNSRTELAKNNASVYNIARKNGWLDDLFPKEGSLK